MPHFDLPLAELERYYPDVEEPVDFDAFWERTLAEVRRHDLALRLRPVDAALARLEVHDVTFAGFGGHPIKAWYVRPARVQARLPVVVSFAGYSAGRGKPWDHTLFPAAGYGVLGVDARGRGGPRRNPVTRAIPSGTGPRSPGSSRAASRTPTATTTGASTPMPPVPSTRRVRCPAPTPRRSWWQGRARAAGRRSRPRRWSPTWPG